MFGRKSQGALEYMLSYGWVLLLLLIIVAVLFAIGIFNPRQSTALQVKQLSNFHIDDALINEDGTLFVEFGVRTGQTTKVTNIDYSLYGYDCINNDDEIDVTVRPDDIQYWVLFPDHECGLRGGEMVMMNVSVDYTTRTSLEHTDIGTIRILVQPQDPLVVINMTKIGPLVHDMSYELPYTITYEALTGGSAQGSLEWEPFRYITESTLDETSPQLALGPNNYVYAVFQRWTNSSVNQTSVYGGDYWDIFTMYSTDNTETWNEAEKITDNTLADVQPNILQANDGSMVIIFQEHDGNDYELFISNSTNGIDWSTPFQITDNSYSEGDATIEQDSGGVYHISYEATIPPDTDSEIYLINSTNLLDWSAPYAITSNSYPDFDPDILILDDVFYLSWSPRVDMINNTQEVYYSKTTTPYNINSWIVNEIRLTNNQEHDFEPSLFIDENDRLFIAYIQWMAYPGIDPDRTMTEIMIADSTITDDTNWNTMRLTRNTVRDTYPGIIQDVTGFHHVFYGRYDDDNLRLAMQDLELNPYDALRMIIYDPIPTDTTLVPGSITHGGTFDGNAITWNLTNVYAGDDGYVKFNVTVDGGTPNATYVTNTAEITYYNWENKIAKQYNKSITTLCIE